MDLNKELRARLREKIETNRINRQGISLKEKKKLDKQVSKDKKEMDADKRITPVMKTWFMNAMASSLKIDVNTPSYILNNLEEEKLKFYKFIIKFMKEVKLDVEEWKTNIMKGLDKIETKVEREEYINNVDAEYKKKFKGYFTTPYIIYMSMMTGINIYEDLLKL
jgi:hypothetical protein